MTLTNLNVHTNPWYPDPTHTTSLPQDAPDGTTRVHFRVPPLREVVLRYLLTPSANQQRLLAPTAATTTAPAPATATPSTTVVACVRQSTTLEESFQLPLQEGALTPSDAALLARLAPAAVSAPRRHALSRATTSGPGAALFSSSTTTTTTTLTTKPTRRGDAAGDAAADTSAAMMEEEKQPPHEQKSSGRCPSPRHCGTAAAAAAQVAGPSWPWARLGPPFVLPAEERYTWVSELAGVRVGETTGGVPLLWRGCGPGCLNFLMDESSKTVTVDAPAGAAPQTEG